VYLIDTNVVSEARKGRNADAGVRKFFADVVGNRTPVFLSVITVGELRRGVELIRHRGDALQARRLEKWLQSVLADFSDNILDIDADIAQLWGRLCVPRPENALDKLIAATALIHGLAVVTCNRRHFSATGVSLLDPFSGGA
jgi:predicted nucleic acid-binding protein